MFGFFKKRKLKSLLQKNKRHRAFLNMEAIRSVLILFETSDYDIVDSFIGGLLGMGKYVDGYAFRVKDDNFDYSETNYTIVGPKENSEKSGAPDKELLRQLKSRRYDVVIDLTIKENFSLQYVLASADATMTVGLKKNNLRLYDFSILRLNQTKGAKNKQVEELITAIVFYLKTIKDTRYEGRNVGPLFS